MPLEMSRRRFGQILAAEVTSLVTGLPSPFPAELPPQEVRTPAEELYSWDKNRILTSPVDFLRFVSRIMNQELQRIATATPSLNDEPLPDTTHLQSFLDRFSPEHSHQPELAHHNLEVLEKGLVDNGLGAQIANLTAFIDQIGISPQDRPESNLRAMGETFNGFLNWFVSPLYSFRRHFYTEDSSTVRFPSQLRTDTHIQVIEALIRWLEPMSHTSNFESQKNEYEERAKTIIAKGELQENSDTIWRYMIKNQEAETGVNRNSDQKRLFDTIISTFAEILPSSIAGFEQIDLTEYHRAYYCDCTDSTRGSTFINQTFFELWEEHRRFKRDSENEELGRSVRHKLNALLILMLHEFTHHLDVSYANPAYNLESPELPIQDLSFLHPAEYVRYAQEYARGLADFYVKVSRLPAFSMEAFVSDPMALSNIPVDEIVDENTLFHFTVNCDQLALISHLMAGGEDTAYLLEQTGMAEYFDQNNQAILPYWHMKFMFTQGPNYMYHQQWAQFLLNPTAFDPTITAGLDQYAYLDANHLYSLWFLGENIFHSTHLDETLKKEFLWEVARTKSMYQLIYFQFLIKAVDAGLITTSHPLYHPYTELQRIVAPHVLHSFNGPLAQYLFPAERAVDLATSPAIQLTAIKEDARFIRQIVNKSLDKESIPVHFTPEVAEVCESLHKRALACLELRTRVWNNDQPDPYEVYATIEAALAAYLGVDQFPASPQTFG